MASALTDKLTRLVKEMRGQARITETNVQDMLREVRMALLEADVALPVVRDFIARVKEKALGQEVLGSLKPGQTLVSIVNRELAATMGDGVADINLAAQPPAVILMAGLQGAGKTTTTAKLAKHLIEKRKKKVLTVSGDVYRPAAIEQLGILGTSIGVDVFSMGTDADPAEIARLAVEKAAAEGYDTVVVDTATLKANPNLGKALAGIWYDTMVVMTADTEEGKAARTAMGTASGTDLAGFEAQMAATKLFDKPADAVAFTASPDLSKTMDLVRNFLFDKGLLGSGAPSADVIGIEMPDGKVLGDKDNVKFRFTGTYMDAAAKGAL